MSTINSSDVSVSADSRGFTLARTFAGLEARLHSTGAGRLTGAAFLGCWLVFWLAGECFALWLLGVGGWSLLTGNPPAPDRAPLPLVPSLGIGAFMIGWLALWTLGGVAAFAEFSRLLWSVDRLRATEHELCAIRRAGLFVRRQCWPREQLRRLYRLADSSVLMVETRDGVVELTRLGSAVQQDRIAVAFTTELKLPAAATLPSVLPSGWKEVSAPEGGVLLIKDPTMRRLQARISWLVALPLGVVAVLAIDAAAGDRQHVGLAMVLLVPAVLALYGATRYQWSRREWRMEAGRIVQQRRVGCRLRHELSANAIQLSESRDSDGDTWYRVEILAADATGKSRRKRQALLTRLHDGTEPRQLGDWIAAATGLPLVDQTTPASKAAERAELLDQLRRSGRWGRWAARWLGRARS